MAQSLACRAGCTWCRLCGQQSQPTRPLPRAGYLADRRTVPVPVKSLYSVAQLPRGSTERCRSPQVDSAVGRDRIQSAPNLRRVHAESAQQHRRRIWWLESEDLGQHLLGRDLGLPAIGPDRFLKHSLCRGRHAGAIFQDGSDRWLLRHGAHRQWGSVGAGPHAQGAQGFLVERLKGLASLLQAHAQHDFDRGILQQGEQDLIGAGSAITSAASLLTSPHVDGPGVKHLWHSGFGGHDDSLLYLVCTDWRGTPRASPICCHDQPFPRAAATWFASTLSARRCSANEARSPIAGSSDERFTLSSSMSPPVSLD